LNRRIAHDQPRDGFNYGMGAMQHRQYQTTTCGIIRDRLGIGYIPAKPGPARLRPLLFAKSTFSGKGKRICARYSLSLPFRDDCRLATEPASSRSAGGSCWPTAFMSGSRPARSRKAIPDPHTHDRA
jgi:hypothetical protein